MPGNWGFVGPTYQSENPGADAERCLNLYPELIESQHPPTNSSLVYYHTPGTTLAATLGDTPVRALWAGNNVLFVLAGAHLYEVNTSTYAVEATYTLANPSGAGPGQIVFIPSGPGLTVATSGALLVWDGSSGVGGGGSTYNNVWYVDGTTGTPPAVISGVGVGCIDGYGVVVRPGCSATAGAADPIPINTTDQTQFNLSAIFLAGPGEWDPLQFAIKTGAPDALQAIMTPGSNQGPGPEELWLFGKQTTEVWYDTGGTSLDPFPFQRVPGAFISEGAWAAYSLAICNNMICFLGGDQRGVGVVWAMNGYTPQRISNHAIEYAIQQTRSAGVDVSNAQAYSYQENGHAFYVLTFPGGRTFVADFSCPDSSGRPMWHERALGSTLGGLSASWQFHAFTGGQHFVGGDGTANVYVSSTSVYQDNGSAILRARIGPAVSQEQKWLIHGQFWLSVAGPYAGVSRTYALDWSNDGGNTYGNQFSLGLQVESTTGFGRIFMNNLGRSRQRNYRVQTTDNLPQCWLDAYVAIG
jgi:hypothetical protein